jgi:hypothetical protein
MANINSERQGETTMLKNILITIVMAAAISMGTMGTARAMLSEPDVIYYGTALNAVSGNSVTIRLNGSTSPLASCTVGGDRKYLLRVPMDAFDPRASGTARSGDAASIAVDGVVPANGSVVIPGRGKSVKLDLGTRTAEQWAEDHPGDDGSGDMNKNGVTDLAEYLAGGDPAGCVWTTVAVGHTETDVSHPQVLKNCLIDAGGDGKHNLIRVARGTYAGNFSYTSSWGEAYNLTLIGGHDPAGVGERLADPALTIFDGGGNGIVLVVDSDASKTPGKVHIESLTVRNGKAPAGQYGGGLKARIHKGDLELVGNIFSGNATDSVSGNTADSGGGLSVESSDSGPVFLTNNVLYGNSAANGAAVRIVSAAGGPVTLLNNTIADNTATAAGDGRSLLVKSVVASVDLTNNIISGVSGESGKEIFVNSSNGAIPLSITHNGFDTVDGLQVNAPGFVSDVSNIGDAPLFEAPLAGNYRLSSTSPLIDKGVSHVKLPQRDVVGALRTSGVGVDLGAYEIRSTVANLSISFSGNGAGSVTSTSPSFSYNTGFTQLVPADTPLTLTAEPAEYSLFGGWGGCDSTVGSVCSLTLGSNRSVIVTFDKFTAHTARIYGATPTYHPTLQEAYNLAVTGNEIEVWGIDLGAGLVCGGEKDVTIRGGYDQPYENRTRTTTLPGLTIGKGSVTVDRIVVK